MVCGRLAWKVTTWVDLFTVYEKPTSTIPGGWETTDTRQTPAGTWWVDCNNLVLNEKCRGQRSCPTTPCVYYNFNFGTSLTHTIANHPPFIQLSFHPVEILEKHAQTSRGMLQDTSALVFAQVQMVVVMVLQGLDSPTNTNRQTQTHTHHWWFSEPPALKLNLNKSLFKLIHIYTHSFISKCSSTQLSLHGA